MMERIMLLRVMMVMRCVRWERRLLLLWLEPVIVRPLSSQHRIRSQQHPRKCHLQRQTKK